MSNINSRKNPPDSKRFIFETPTIRNFAFIIGLLISALCAYISYQFGFTKPEIISVIAVSIAIITIFYNSLHLQNNYDLNKAKLLLDKQIASLNTLTEWYKDFSMKSKAGKYFREKHFIGENLKNQDLLNKFETGNDEDGVPFRTSVMPILNYFEKISIGIRDDVLDEKIVRDFFYDIFIKYQEAFGPVMRDRTEGPGAMKSAFSEYNAICEKWKKT